MAKDAIVFICANPIPEMWPWEAKEAGAKIVATGRSDFPNQMNNSPGFPAMFKGILDVGARSITDEMCITAARAISNYAEEKGLNEEYIIPTMGETEMFIQESVTVGLKAIDRGVARIKRSKEELKVLASSAIQKSQGITKIHLEKGFIQLPTE